MCHDHPKMWSTYLCWAELHYNIAIHSPIKMSPFQALYGRLPPQLPLYSTGFTKAVALDSLLLERRELLSTLKTHLAQAQNRMKNQADRRRIKELCRLVTKSW